VNLVISILNLAVFPGGNYLLRKALENVSQVAKAFGSTF